MHCQYQHSKGKLELGRTCSELNPTEQRCIFHSDIAYCGGSNQFSAEWRPPVPARKAMPMRSGFSGEAEAQFHRHAPQ